VETRRAAQLELSSAIEIEPLKDYILIAFCGRARTSLPRQAWLVCALVRRTWHRPVARPSVRGQIEMRRGDDV